MIPVILFIDFAWCRLRSRHSSHSWRSQSWRFGRNTNWAACNSSHQGQCFTSYRVCFCLLISHHACMVACTCSHIATYPTQWLATGLCDCSYEGTNHERFPVGDPNKRAFTYFVLTGSRFMYASAVRLVVLKFLLSWAVRCFYFLSF